MKKMGWQISLGILLVALSVVFYGLHYLIFKDAHHIFIYLLGDIAFVPIEVLLVTLIIHRVLSNREKQAMLRKMNMVIGAFFDEVGTELIRSMSAFDATREGLAASFAVDAGWTSKDFERVAAEVKAYVPSMDTELSDMVAMKAFLSSHRGFMLRLLENPNLLEHDSFTDLLWAVFHVGDELDHRPDVTRLGRPDRSHLAGDFKRAYVLLLKEWLDYMGYLKGDYPYLFSLAVRTNPFMPESSAEVI